ncbi:major royal jelly protein-domain-containing protein [Coniella lustricola]|uniref:Major royal jelly protein-domain-containing protein n=1 Tax=Coniella lustricola TaxID=2025994 RepID=A0A2T3A334_9PEZI|nr:major royal jelly protein-domain-containing protein [Coniella lustricola]
MHTTQSFPSKRTTALGENGRTVTRSNTTNGVCPQDFTIIGDALDPVHESTDAPTGLAVDANLNIYLTYPRNAENSTNNVVICTSFTGEEPWPSAEIQQCSVGQDPATCFINVQNVVLDSLGQMWIVDSGIVYGSGSQAASRGAKLMSFNVTTRELIKTYLFPDNILFNGTNLNDVRINNTAGTGGFAFLTDESPRGGVVAVNLDTGGVVKRLNGTSVVMADPTFVGVYNGQPIYCWNGTTKSFCNTASDGIALQSGNMYWGILASRRFYYVPQDVLQNFAATDDEVLAAVQDPGELGSEQAGFTADDQGRLFMLASEQNAIFYVQTDQARVTKEINGVAAGGSGPVAASNYRVQTLVRSGLIQHADSAAILDGYLYFCTNQLSLAPARQYDNIDARKGPFRSYRLQIGAGPAV